MDHIRQGARGTGLIAGDGLVEIGVVAPDAALIAAAATGDCVAAQEEELGCDLARGVHAESWEGGESGAGEDVPDGIHLGCWLGLDGKCGGKSGREFYGLWAENCC